MKLSLYETKKFLLRPRTAYRRRRETSKDMIGRIMLEGHYYRTPMYDFFGAVATNPDLMTDFDLAEGAVVVDVGAYTGEWAAPMAERHDVEIHAFEPAEDGLAELTETLGSDPHVHIHPYGLAERDFSSTMALNGPGSSIYEDDGLYGSQTAEIRDVVPVFDQLGLTHIDLLKSNIEGAEYDLFDRLLDAAWLPRIDRVLVQFHEWHPWAYWRRARIRRRLKQTHDQVWNYDFVWEYWRRKP
ncbi:MAG: FkbM family methyltransferase [Acidimicrobiales bacterium]